MNVVVVESPAKAKTINKYLGSEFTVLASYGHVRDLPAKDGSVRPDDGFAMDWEVDPRSEKHVRAIAQALRGARRLYLATDPDREGEAISWHVCQVLNEKKVLEGVDIKRVVFNSITRDAILDAFANPRDLNRELVDAYMARRALDYLVGFTLSPVLWRKLPGSRSAGRVQSVALRLICERETEIENFVSREYWTIEALLRTPREQGFTATLTYLDGKKLDKFDLPDRASADRAVAAIEARTFAVDSIERKQVRRQPFPPFVTSTLQQEASRKLSFSASHTMRVAQRLYEGVSLGGETVGLITYMRTDGVQMAGDAIHACRDVIEVDFGKRYVPEKPRIYKTKAKNAQEAHEAIRPTDLKRRPADVAPFLEADQLKLYTLIWKRTVASQMEAAILDQVAVDIASPDKQVKLRANGSVIAFDGFLKVYRESKDDPDQDAAGAVAGGDDSDRLLPELAVGEDLARDRIDALQHFTQPPPRYSEASLVKRLEELGIGRPSTYATILSVLQERKYVRLEKRRFIPEDRGRLVTAFLTSFFDRYIAYGFTAEMEEKLDDVSGGRIDWKEVLSQFWDDFSGAVDGTKGLRIKEVLDALDALLGPHFFRPREDGSDPRTCPACADGRLALKLGKFGAFIGCSNYPTCRYTRPLVPNGEDVPVGPAAAEGNTRSFGTDPETGLLVTLRKGPYGFYLQLGESNGEGGKGDAKPRRTSLPAGCDPTTLDLNAALGFLRLPRVVGVHPETGQEITAGLGRFGPYLRHGDTYVSLKSKDGDDVITIGLNRAVDLIASSKPKKPRGRILGDHPDDNKPVTVSAGRFGAYVQHNATRVTLPPGVDAKAITLGEALELIAAKAAKTKPKTSKTATKTAKAPAKVKSAEEKLVAPSKPKATKKATTSKAPATKGSRKPKGASTTEEAEGS